LNSVLRQLDKLYLLQEVAGCPDFAEGRILYDTLRATGKSMNDEIAKYKLSFTEYREYIELWVHEIKTPIAGAKLIAGNEGNAAALDAIDRIESFVEQALYYARSNAVEKDYVINPVMLSELVGGALKSNSKFLIARGIAVRTNDLNYEVFTDAKWVVFILRQIIDNAVKYRSSVIEFSGELHRNGASLLISDNGIGIPDRDMAKVFQKGFTGSNGREYGHSTGLGLYLCRKLCLKLGIGISIASQPGRSTTVEISFPKGDI
jgi:signal transduction histidine kinase